MIFCLIFSLWLPKVCWFFLPRQMFFCIFLWERKIDFANNKCNFFSTRNTFWCHAHSAVVLPPAKDKFPPQKNYKMFSRAILIYLTDVYKCMRALSHTFLEQSERIYYRAIVSPLDWNNSAKIRKRIKGPAQEPRSLRDGAWTRSKAFLCCGTLDCGCAKESTTTRIWWKRNTAHAIARLVKPRGQEADFWTRREAGTECGSVKPWIIPRTWSLGS